MASCAFPKLFEPQPLWIKQYAMNAESLSPYELVSAVHLYENEHFLDGSLSNDIPMERLQQLFNVCAHKLSCHKLSCPILRLTTS